MLDRAILAHFTPIALFANRNRYRNLAYVQTDLVQTVIDFAARP
jgi:hypothetical protein